jgi:hypothetical protein
MAKSQNVVEFSVRVYRVLINVYPASFRREYGDQMTQVFRELATDALRERGAMGLVTAWFRVLADLGCTATKENLLELLRRFSMNTSASADDYIRLISRFARPLAISAVHLAASVAVYGTLWASGPRGLPFDTIKALQTAMLTLLSPLGVIPLMQSLPIPIALLPLFMVANSALWGFGSYWLCWKGWRLVTQTKQVRL